jgi:hypothetical protein
VRVSEWSTYLPDGRPVRIQRQDAVWIVECEHAEARGADLRTTIEEATRVQHASIHAARERQQLAAWIEQHAAQMEREAGLA